eukprot:4549090-Prymnesium_polylepis.1
MFALLTAASLAATAPASPRRRALLLDIDGTLVRTDGLYFDVFAKLLAPFGYDVTPDWYEKNVHGGVDAVVFKRLMPDTYTEADLLDMSKQKDALVRREPTARGCLLHCQDGTRPATMCALITSDVAVAISSPRPATLTR